VAEAGVKTRQAVARWSAAALAAITLPAVGATHTIIIDGMQFSPAIATVKRGDTVVWLNKDLVPHTATVAKVFDSGSVAPGMAWRITASQPGRYDYVCTLHPTMKAVLVVEK
jgi:plastocyanin